MKRTATVAALLAAACALPLAFAGPEAGKAVKDAGSAMKDEAKKGAEGAAKAAMGEKDIVDTAVAAGQFNTLAAALKAADLVDTLKGKGPFTVFAPTDEAFKKLPAGTVETLLKPENKDKLKAILTYHVVAANVMAADAIKMDGKEAKTVNGQSFKIVVKDGKVTVGNDPKNMATVTKADVKATNGVIHVIDTVILPKDEPKKDGGMKDSDKK